MLKSFFKMPVNNKSLLAGIAVIIFLALMFWGFIRLQQVFADTESEPILKVGYCGVEPDQLCVLSFGRDQEDNMIIHVYVPDRSFPIFYLKANRASIESLYECKKDRRDSTSIYCTGPLLGLKDKVEISLFAKEDDRLLAAGKLTVQAILLSPVDDGQPIEKPEETTDR